MIRCVFCGREGQAPFPPTPMRNHGWDWFTGYMDETAHCCPQCLDTHYGHWVVLFDFSRRIPKPGEKRYSMRACLAAAMEGKPPT